MNVTFHKFFKSCIQYLYHNVLLFKSLLANHGKGLVDRGYISIYQNQILVDNNIKSCQYLCEYNNSNIWFLYTQVDNYMLIDLKTEYLLTGMKIRGIKDKKEYNTGYPWDIYQPSYALEFSNDNKTFYTLFQETNSTRITNINLETEYFFNTKGYFRYFRLRETDLANGHYGHGQYIAWLDFYVMKNFCTDNNLFCFHFRFLYLLISSIVYL